MTRYARIADGLVAEIIVLEGMITLPDPENEGQVIERPITPVDAFHPDIAATMIAAGVDVEPGWSYSDGAFSPPLDPNPPTDAERKVALIAYLKERRWQIETSGVTVTIAGAPVLVSTRRGDDRTTLHQTYSAIKDGLRGDDATFNFADGLPRAVSNADMLTATLAALAHVQAAFDLEGAITPQIQSGQITTPAAIDGALGL
jgi:hypothetical protein